VDGTVPDHAILVCAAMITDRKSKRDAWHSIANYHFANLVPIHLTDRVTQMFGGPDASTKAFASKLSRKLGWSTAFGLRAIHEYKRFVYLGVVSATNVTPSKVIDQVWHEHQLFTKAYRDFCRDVIYQDFDHTPELIPVPEQTLLFSRQYLSTLSLYRSEFNAEPPDDIWSVAKFQLDREEKQERSVDAVFCGGYYAADPPLHTLVDLPQAEFHGFGGGESGGAGASDHYGTGHHSHSHSSSDSGHGGDSSGGGGSSDGCSDGGGSSCSSSCGGGGCGSS
jgi:hypothetical protein